MYIMKKYLVGKVKIQLKYKIVTGRFRSDRLTPEESAHITFFCVWMHLKIIWRLVTLTKEAFSTKIWRNIDEKAIFFSKTWIYFRVQLLSVKWVILEAAGEEIFSFLLENGSMLKNSNFERFDIWIESLWKIDSSFTYLLYISTSGLHNLVGCILILSTPPYSDTFHLRL